MVRVHGAWCLVFWCSVLSAHKPGSKHGGGFCAAAGSSSGRDLNAATVLKIDPSDDSVSTFGSLGDGGGKWYGGVLAASFWVVGASWKHFGASWGRLGPKGRVLRHLGAVVGTF